MDDHNMGNRIEYAPPPLNQGVLSELMLGKYKHHRKTPELRRAISDLVLEYVKFWHLMLQYKHNRIVAPGPIMAVLHVHRSCYNYFDDCMAYFNYYLVPHQAAWQGTTDIRGVKDTVDSYKDEYRCRPPEQQWRDFLDLYYLNRPKLYVVH